MSLQKGISLTSIACVLTACGGGGGGGGDTSAPPAPLTVVDELHGGIWSGTTTGSQGGGTQDLIGVSTDDGRFRFLSLDTGGQFIGTSTVDGTSITGSGIGYAPIGYAWIDGSVYTDVTLSGTINERSTFSGNWAASTGETGTFNFAYESLHQRDSSLGLVADTWISFNDSGNPIGTVSIDAAGRLDGQDAAGCLYSGTVSIIDANYNVYDLSLSVLNCSSANGDYSGLGILTDNVNQNDTFVYTVDKGTFAFSAVIFR